MKRIGMIALLFGVLVAGSALAYGFHSEEERTAIQEAVENKDYDAWKAAMEAAINEENFDRIIEQHQRHADMLSRRTAIQEAFENKDYDAYIEAVGTQITEEEFLKMAEDRMMPGIGMRMRGTGISRCTLP